MFGVPPHLGGIAIIALVSLFVWFLAYFRRNIRLRRAFQSVFYQDTPENALQEYYEAHENLTRHFRKGELTPELAEEIGNVLGLDPQVTE